MKDVTRGFQERLGKVMDYLGDRVLTSRMGGDEFSIVLNEKPTPEMLFRIKELMGCRVAGLTTHEVGNEPDGQGGYTSKDVDVLRDDTAVAPITIHGEVESDRETIIAFRTFAKKVLLMGKEIELLKQLEKKGKGDSIVNVEANDGKLAWYVYEPAGGGQYRKYGAEELNKDNAQADIKGGIDFNSNLVNLQTEGQRANFDWGPDGAGADSATIDGLAPVILNIAPVENLSRLLGAAAK